MVSSTFVRRPRRSESGAQGRRLSRCTCDIRSEWWPDGAQLSAGERGLQHVGSIDGALGRAGADQGVQLVDEQDDLSLGVFDLFQNGFQAIFKFATILGSGEHRAQVERDDSLILENLGNIARDDALRQTLDDRRFAQRQVRQSARVVLGAAGKHLHHTPDFFVSSDDRIQFAAPGLLGQVAGVALERLILGFRVLIGDLLRPSNRGEGLQDGVVGGP